jgi:hypothetical protein
MSRSCLASLSLGVAVCVACSAENPANSGASGGSSGNAGAGAAAGGSSGSGGAPAVGGTGGSGAQPSGGTGGGATSGGSAGTSGGGGTAGSGGSSGATNPGNYPLPPRDINVTSTQAVSIPVVGGTARFDPTAEAGIQKKLVLPLGGVNSGPMNMGWAVERGFHMIGVPFWNNYPNDMYHREYLESWSGEDLSAQITQPPSDCVMARVKTALTELAAMDPGSDWAYYLDTAGEVRWNDVIVFGYSFGGQMGVAASKYVALDRVIITASPNIPIESPWLTEMPTVTPVERCYQFVGFNEGEHDTHIAETTLLGWTDEPFDVEDGITQPPPYLSNRLIVDDGHSDFCGRPFNDGMKDWDAICEWLFNVQ